MVGQISLERDRMSEEGHELEGRMTFVGQCQIFMSNCSSCPTPVAGQLLAPPNMGYNCEGLVLF